MQELGQRYETQDSSFHDNTVSDMKEFQRAEEVLVDPDGRF